MFPSKDLKIKTVYTHHFVVIHLLLCMQCNIGKVDETRTLHNLLNIIMFPNKDLEFINENYMHHLFITHLLFCMQCNIKINER